MMTREEFKSWLQQQPALSQQVCNAIAAAPPNTIGAIGDLSEDEIVALMFPIVRFVLTEIGLPWQHEKRTYADLWRHKFRSWIDEQLDELGLHPYAVEAAGVELRRLLTEETDEELRESWEGLAVLLRTK